MSESGSYDDATLARKYAMAQALMKGPEKPITHWVQGLDQLGKAALGTWQMSQLDDQREAEKAKSAAELYTALGLPAPDSGPAKISNFERIGSLLSGNGWPGPAQAAAPAVATSASPADIPAPQVVPAMDASQAPIGPNDPSPLDTAPYPAGPMGAPSGPQLPRGLRNNNPLNIEAGNFTSGQPGFAGSDGRFAKFETPDQGVAAASKLLDTYQNKYGLNTPTGIIGRWAPQGENNTNAYAASIAKQLGIGPNDPIPPEMRSQLIAAMSKVENGQATPQTGPQAIAAALQGGASGVPTTMPAATAPAPAAATSAPGGGILAGAPPAQRAQIAQLLTSNNPTAKALGSQLLGNYTKLDAPTDETKEYNLAKKEGFNGTFMDFKTQLKQAGATKVTTNVDQKGEDSFAKAAGSAQAKRFDDLAADAPAAKQMISDVQTLQQLGSQIGTGKGAEFKAAVGPMAEALGIKVDGLSDIQAYESIVNRVAPGLRVKGSGAQSDLELKNFLKSLPSLGNTPEGNELVGRTMQGLQANKLKAAEIGSQALTGEITRKEAERRLQDLPDPMQEWRDQQKAAKAAKPSAATSDAGGVKEGATATNPQTKETIIFRGGKWVPMT